MSTSDNEDGFANNSFTHILTSLSWTVSVVNTVRIPDFRTDILPYRSVISRLSRYYDALDLTQPFQTSSPIPVTRLTAKPQSSCLSDEVAEHGLLRARDNPSASAGQIESYRNVP